MKEFYTGSVKKSDRIGRLVDNLYRKMPEIEADRAVLYTESYKKTEGEPVIIRKAKAFANILENIPIIIRDEELIVGSATQAPRGCQTFPEYSYKWLEEEFETVTTRSADPFYITEETKSRLREANKYWEGKTNSDLATSYMEKRTIAAIDYNIFTPGNYFYNGIGHVTVKYGEILAYGYEGIEKRVLEEMENIKVYDPDYPSRKAFLEAVLISCRAVVTYAKRYAALAKEMAEKESNINRKQELLKISEICNKVPERGAETFYEACQSFWFVQLLIQIESSGHSISPGRFDQYMYPYYKEDMDKGIINREIAQELIDCVWVKLNDLTKVRDLASAEGFAGYSQFQNLIAGGQDKYGVDATNDLSFMCLEATMHVQLPQPSLSVRVWNGTPHEFMLKAAELTRMGMGLPAYYNDEVIIPALISRGLTMEDARDYNIIGCVEPQKSGKTDGWHDAAFFNMCRPLELVFSNGMDNGYQLGKKTGDISEFDTFEKFYDAYKSQMDDMIELMVNADNAIDLAHAERNPLPYLSSMIDDCISRGKSVQNGGAVYNFTGPQGFGIANMADSLYAIKKLVYDEKKITLEELKEALDNNYGRAVSDENTEKTAVEVIKKMTDSGIEINDDVVASVIKEIRKGNVSADKKRRYEEILEMINGVTKFGNNNEEVDSFARDVAYTYTRPLEKYKNPRGGIFHAGLYPVSANVPLGAKTGATPDGRFAYTPVADGVSPSAGKDVNGPTASANSVSKLDHYIASNGTLFNMKFHPSALAGQSGLEGFVSLVRGYFDQKGSHMQFNVVSRETLIEAQKNPEKYKGLVVRVAGYSALFTTLSKSLQDDIISRTEQSNL